MNRTRGVIKILSMWCMGVLCAVAFGQAAAVSGAAFTTVNESVDGTGHCQNGNPTINCNIYDGKQYVWLNGGPLAASLGNGTYFFAVLVPGGQGGNQDPNDCTDKNLSDVCVTTNTGAGDAWTNRVFTITGGTISYTGDGVSTPHDFANNKIRLMPYDDTTNNGGVYIMAICQVPQAVTSTNPPGVDPRDCKYDAFKINPPGTTTVSILACKFNDRSDDGQRQPGTEPLIPNWPITANINGTPVTQSTDESGCTFFDVNSTDKVILSEGTLGAGWIQTAPSGDDPGGQYTVIDQGTPGDPNYVVTLVNPITDGLEVDFGNFNPLCSQPDTCGDEPGLDIVKSAKNTTTWGITKMVDKTLVEQVGGSATFNYTVGVTYTLSNVVSGTITLSNNSPADIKVDTLTDSLGGCSFTAPATVAAGDTVMVDYTCSLGSATTNTATVTWTDFGGGSATTGAVAIQFIDTCVAVTDSYAGSLGSVCNNSATNPTNLTYSRTVTVPTFNCVSYDNKATFTTNDTGATGSASQSVKVCGPAKTGALTMGFWQNNNGQNIIKGGSSTSGVCNSATWLRQYAPFQDLSATATCAQVATYVYNLIKGAGSNCGGATCNAMLKAQMLATALDVYFSDPALGGNKISAPAPIGGVKIDLTKICTNIPTCSSFENDSSAFGGATSLTVSAILSYAASQSNSGGSTWYGNVKATQVKAKDVFDAINNQVAFAP
jgi:hypothetical protein